jgi:hypothetical protein
VFREESRDPGCRRNPRLTTCFDDLAAAIRAWAKGLLCLEAAVELLIGNSSWLFREDFAEIAVEFTTEADGMMMAAVDFTAAAGALEAGALPCSAGERRVLQIAASLAAGVPVDLREAVTGLDTGNAVLGAAAVLHAAGCRDLSARLSGGQGRR